MPKRLLVLRYSQSGQLDAITDALLAPLRQDSTISLHIETLTPQTAFPFPWSLRTFFDTFPECVHQRPAPLAPLSLSGDEDFDLIILPWQVWFLAPSQPITAFLQHPIAAKLLRGKPVISLIACRNMWMMAWQDLQQLLHQCGARLIDNIVLTDQAATLTTLVTTPLWLLSGRRQVIKWLPPAGITPTQIADCRRFGEALQQALQNNDERTPNALLQGLGAVEANPALWLSERTGRRSFAIWGKLLLSSGRPGSPQRALLLWFYALFLICLILTVVPTSLLLQKLFRPLFKQRLARIKAEFEQPSGSGRERLSAGGYNQNP